MNRCVKRVLICVLAIANCMCLCGQAQSPIELTLEQKKADIAFLFGFIGDNYPFLDVIETEKGLDNILSLRSEYITRAGNTRSDREFIQLVDEIIVRLRQGTRHANIMEAQDILPTLIDWCKLKSPKNAEFDGSSLAPLFSDHPDVLNHRILVVEYDNPYRPGENKAVMWKKWRLVKDSELYNLSSDPGQTTNVANKHPDVLSHMQDYYRRWRQDANKGYIQKRYIHLGSEAQNPLMLYSSDWHGAYADNMNNLLAGNRIGSWEVLVEKTGMYEFTLSRWHPASGMALTGSMKDTRGRNRGALCIKQTRLRIGDYDRTISTETDQAEVTFKVELPEGIHKIETWFMDEKGKQLCSAYYTKAELMN
ncbi:hypothetical protein ACFL6U_14960 [Planctomycetota bacterium]